MWLCWSFVLNPEHESLEPLSNLAVKQMATFFVFVFDGDGL